MKMTKKDKEKLTKALAKKEEMKVWTNVDQYDLDREIKEYRRKGWQLLLKQIRKDHTIPTTLEELQEWDKGLTTKERTLVHIGLAAFNNLIKKPVYKCKECSDTGFLREGNGVFLIEQEKDKKSYLAGKSGSPDGLIAYSAPAKCSKCSQ
jgi:nitrogen fixation protein